MITTRAAIRRKAVSLARTTGRSVGFASRDGGTTALTATGGSATTLIDTAGLPPAGASPKTAEGWWIYRPAQAAADQRRIVDSYSGANRTFTIETGTNWATSPASSDPYLVLRDDPDTWDAAISEALTRMLSKRNEATFTPTVNRKVRYDLSAAPISITGLARETQVFNVEYRSSADASGEEKWKPFADGYRTWRAVQVGATTYLDFEDPDRAPNTDEVLRVTWLGQYAALTDETTTTDADLDWAAWATLAVMGEWLADPDNPSDDWTMIGARANEHYLGLRRQILGPDAFTRVTRTSQQRPIFRVRGRGGR